MIPSGSATRARLRAESLPGSYSHFVALPDGYADDPQRRWPLILFLHGAASRGSDLGQITCQGLPRLLANPPDLTAAETAAAAIAAREFIVVAPQCPHYEVWDEAWLLALLAHAAATLRVDSSRVYLVGLSMGGFGAWSLGLRHPERFAALVAVCGGGRLADVGTARRDRANALRTLGIWAFHGAKDAVVPLEESQRMIDALGEAGVAEAKLTVYPEAGHDAWSETFANPDLYAWLLQQRR